MEPETSSLGLLTEVRLFHEPARGVCGWGDDFFCVPPRLNFFYLLSGLLSRERSKLYRGAESFCINEESMVRLVTTISHELEAFVIEIPLTPQVAVYVSASLRTLGTVPSGSRGGTRGNNIQALLKTILKSALLPV
jgi:hypothetical protein